METTAAAQKPLTARVGGTVRPGARRVIHSHVDSAEPTRPQLVEPIGPILEEGRAARHVTVTGCEGSVCPRRAGVIACNI